MSVTKENVRTHREAFDATAFLDMLWTQKKSVWVCAGLFLFLDLAHNIPNECFPFLQAAYGSLRPFPTSKQFSQNSKTKIYLSIQHS